VVPELRLAAIVARVRLGVQTAEDRDELLRLGSWGWSLDYNWREEVPESLLRGWPRDEAVKRVSLDSTGHGGPDDRIIELEFAQRILLEGYPGDADVAAFCVRELGSEHPFVMVSYGAWSLLARGFRDVPSVVDAVDAHFAGRRYVEPQLALAALVGRTDAMKRRLLEDLNISGVPHWAARSLLEGWGMGDADVASGLHEIASGPADLASRIALYLPEIIPDRARCRDRLLAILEDASCTRADFVLDGLDTLGTRGDVGAMDTIMALLPERPRWRTDPIHDVIGRIIQFYAWDPRAREIAGQELARRDGCHNSVVRAFGDDPEIRREIIRYANPLPSGLRARIARGLRPGAGSDEFLVTTLSRYDHEPDGMVKTEASIAFHRAIRALDRDTAGALDALREAIVATGPDHEVRRQAAFAGLVELERVGEFESARDWRGVRPDLPLSSFARPNLPLMRVILQNWERTRPIFAPALERDEGAFWEMLCILADEYPGPRDDAVRFFEGQAEAAPGLNELRFLARARPGSSLLLSKCMKALGIGEGTRLVKDREAIAAAEIVGAQFSRDEEVRDRIVADCTGRWFPTTAIMALCEGWPESPVLDRAYDPSILEDRHTLLTFAGALRLAGLKAARVDFERVINRLLANPRGARNTDVIVPPIVRRLRSDDELFTRLTERLFADPSPSEQASFPRLLALSRGLSPELRGWALGQIDRQVGGRGPVEIGLDLAAGTHRAVWHSLMDMLV
jgi:hypothetical protein